VKVRRVVGAILSIFLPGAGHPAVGRPWRGLTWLAASLALFASIPATGLPGLGAFVLIRFAAAADVLLLREANLRPAPFTQAFAAALALLGVAVLARGAIVGSFYENYRIPAGSMGPTLRTGDWIVVDKAAYQLRAPLLGRVLRDRGTPRRGDVIVFRYPLDRDVHFVKRVVALPGDTVEIRDRTLHVGGRPAGRAGEEPCTLHELDETRGAWLARELRCAEEDLLGNRYRIALDPSMPHPAPFPDSGQTYVVPDGHVFVLGDNRDNSHDSRHWGSVPLGDVRGKVVKVLWATGPDGIDWTRSSSAVR
jgi:signal peptidase I